MHVTTVSVPVNSVPVNSVPTSSEDGSRGSSRPSGRGGTAAELLADARVALERARTTVPVPARLALAQVAAVRAAGAVLALRARPCRQPRSRRRQPGHQPGSRSGSQPSAWDLLRRLAPELGEWADYFAVPADLGAAEACPDRVADDRVRDAERFLAVVERAVARGRRRPS